MRELVQRLLVLHRRDEAGFCADDGQHWPCKTARIIGVVP